MSFPWGLAGPYSSIKLSSRCSGHMWWCCQCLFWKLWAVLVTPLPHFKRVWCPMERCGNYCHSKLSNKIRALRHVSRLKDVCLCAAQVCSGQWLLAKILSYKIQIWVQRLHELNVYSLVASSLSHICIPRNYQKIVEKNKTWNDLKEFFIFFYGLFDFKLPQTMGSVWPASLGCGKRQGVLPYVSRVPKGKRLAHISCYILTFPESNCPVHAVCSFRRLPSPTCLLRWTSTFSWYSAPYFSSSMCEEREKEDDFYSS